jgi:hypothetical protein
MRKEQERIRIEKENEERLSNQLIQQVIQEEENLSVNQYLVALGNNPITPSITNNVLSSITNSNHTRPIEQPLASSNTTSIINYFNNINQQQQQHTPGERQPPPRRRSILSRSNTIVPSTSTSTQIRTNLLKKTIIKASNSKNSQATTTTTPNMAARSSHSVDNEEEAEDTNSGSIARSVKLRPRHSIKRNSDETAMLLRSSTKYESKANRIAESSSDSLFDAETSVEESSDTTTAKKKPLSSRRKINVNSHLDTSSSNSSSLSDVSTVSSRPIRKVNKSK